MWNLTEESMNVEMKNQMHRDGEDGMDQIKKDMVDDGEDKEEDEIEIEVDGRRTRRRKATCLEDKPGISIMADRGFTIKDMLKAIGVDLNIPPFMEGRQQLPASEVQEGRRIASVRIHVERAIGRIKTFNILKHTLPISLARLSNQIVFVCAYLSNFKPVLVPPESTMQTENEMDIDKYFEDMSDSDGSGEDSD